MGKELDEIINSGQEPEHRYFVAIRMEKIQASTVYIFGCGEDKVLTVKERCITDKADLLPNLIEGMNELNQVYLAIIYSRDKDVVLKGEENLVIIEKMNIDYNKEVKFEESIIRSIRKFFRRLV